MVLSVLCSLFGVLFGGCVFWVCCSPFVVFLVFAVACFLVDAFLLVAFLCVCCCACHFMCYVFSSFFGFHDLLFVVFVLGCVFVCVCLVCVLSV